MALIENYENTPKIRRLSHYQRRPIGLDVSPVTREEIPKLHEFVKGALGPGIASAETVSAVHGRQSFGLWKVLDAQKAWSGAYAFLYLNQAGLDAVYDGTFNSREPELSHLADTPSEVVAIFAWCLVLRGKSKAALLKAATWLDLCGWNNCPIFTNPVTPRGTQLAQKLGFRPLDPTGATNVHVVN